MKPTGRGQRGTGESLSVSEHRRHDGGGVDPARPGSRLLDQIPYLIVLAGIAGGLAWIGLHHFKRGSVLITGILVLGAFFRLVLPKARVGLLAVRSQLIDVMTLWVLGVGIGSIALSTPPHSVNLTLIATVGGVGMVAGLVAIVLTTWHRSGRL